MKRQFTAAILAWVTTYVPAEVPSALPAPAPIRAEVPVFPATVAGVALFITTSAPKVSPKEAKRLAKLIIAVSERRGLDPLLLAAIVRYESGGFQKHLKICTTWGGCDSGLGQINHVWVRMWKLDAARLVKDDAYNLEVAARILQALQRDFSEQDPKWWSRYHDRRDAYRKIWEERAGPYVALATRKETLWLTAERSMLTSIPPTWSSYQLSMR
jgi:hypothetical protein